MLGGAACESTLAVAWSAYKGAVKALLSIAKNQSADLAARAKQLDRACQLLHDASIAILPVVDPCFVRVVPRYRLYTALTRCAVG